MSVIAPLFLPKRRFDTRKRRTRKFVSVDLINHTLSKWHKHFDAEMKQVKANNNAVLRFMEDHISKSSNQVGSDSHDDWAQDDWLQQTKPRSKNQVTAPSQTLPPAEKSVTLSFLLNVIDGAAAMEVRLLIMTTNHPEKLDPALTRCGRCDSRYHIGYATKNSLRANLQAHLWS